MQSFDPGSADTPPNREELISVIYRLLESVAILLHIRPPRRLRAVISVTRVMHK